LAPTEIPVSESISFRSTVNCGFAMARLPRQAPVSMGQPVGGHGRGGQVTCRRARLGPVGLEAQR
jgi:hypothetical protein